MGQALVRARNRQRSARLKERGKRDGKPAGKVVAVSLVERNEL
jgi:hypothetical protein